MGINNPVYNAHKNVGAHYTQHNMVLYLLYQEKV